MTTSGICFPASCESPVTTDDLPDVLVDVGDKHPAPGK